MKDVGSDPTRWRDFAPESLNQGEAELDRRAAAQAATIVRQIGEPVLPSAATMEAVRARIELRRGPRPRVRRGLTWALVTFVLIFGVTLGAAAHSWISKRWTAPKTNPAPVEMPASPTRPKSQARNRPAPAPAEVEAPPVVESPVLPAPEVPPKVAQHPIVSPESPGHGQRSTVKLASVSPAPFPVQSPPPNADGASESQAVGVALRKLRQYHDARGALDALEQYRTSFPNGRLGAEASLIRVEALLAFGDRAAALRLLDDDASLGHGPRARELLVLRGELRASANRCAEAVADLGRSLSATPHDTVDERALFARASCLSRLHQFDAARSDLEQYQAHFPTGANAAVAASLLQSLR
jgi:tetratricopeptide (TPR) repeat protein